MAALALQGGMNWNSDTGKDLAASTQWQRQSEAVVSHALQRVARLMDRLHGLFDKHVCTLDTSAHPENVHEAVVQHVVDVVGEALDGGAAHIFDAPSTRPIA